MNRPVTLSRPVRPIMRHVRQCWVFLSTLFPNLTILTNKNNWKYFKWLWQRQRRIFHYQRFFTICCPKLYHQNKKVYFFYLNSCSCSSSFILLHTPLSLHWLNITSYSMLSLVLVLFSFTYANLKIQVNLRIFVTFYLFSLNLSKFRNIFYLAQPG